MFSSNAHAYLVVQGEEGGKGGEERGRHAWVGGCRKQVGERRRRRRDHLRKSKIVQPLTPRIVLLPLPPYLSLFLLERCSLKLQREAKQGAVKEGVEGGGGGSS